MKVLCVPCLYDNYAYILYNQKNNEAAIIDPSEGWPVIREMQNRNLQPVAVLCTHHHHDHIGGIEDLVNEYGDLRIIGSDPERIKPLTEQVRDNDRVEVCGMQGTVLSTPGHTTTSVVYRFDNLLFVGDTLFGAGCGRLFEGTPAEMVASLNRIVDCGSDARVYFGHEYTELNLRFSKKVEPENSLADRRRDEVSALRRDSQPSTPSTVAEELATNPFLRTDEPVIIDTLKKNHGLEREDPLAVFTLLRELRNSFS